MPPPRQLGSYAGLSKPLPDPPKGQEWAHDASTREWKLVPTATTAPPQRDDRGGGGGGVECDAPPPPPSPLSTATTTAVAGGLPRRHEVLPTDTFRGICLRYGVSPVSLRRANNMLGDDLNLAPDVLVVPPPPDGLKRARGGRSPTREEKVASLVFRARLTWKVELSNSEARAYLEMAGWDPNIAIENVGEDSAWSAGSVEGAN
jgi:hypothetical protein